MLKYVNGKLDLKVIKSLLHNGIISAIIRR